MLEGPGTGWGEYGLWSPVCPSGGICGLESKVEEYSKAWTTPASTTCASTAAIDPSMSGDGWKVDQADPLDRLLVCVFTLAGGG